VGGGAFARVVDELPARFASAVGVADDVDAVKGPAFVVMLDPGRLGGIDEAMGDEDELTCDIPVDFPGDAVEVDGAVATDASADPQGERGAQALLVEAVDVAPLLEI
jgi:hypothetical protein